MPDRMASKVTIMDMIFVSEAGGDPHVRILGIEYFACAGIHEHGGADIEDLSGRGALGGVGFRAFRASAAGARTSEAAIRRNPAMRGDS